MNLILAIAAFAVVIGVFLFLSRSAETRGDRWPKIICSLPFVLIIGNGILRGVGLTDGIGVILSICFVAFIWCGNLAWLVSGSLVDFMYRDVGSITGGRTDYRFAKNHRRDGELPEALEATQHELKKDPKNYEGLLLLSGIYQDMKLPNEASAALEIILDNPDATEPQKEVAREEKKKCELLRRHVMAQQR